MPTYSQTYNISEQNIGDYYIKLVISDTYAGLFLESLPTDIIDIDTSDEKLELEDGSQAEDELNFSINEAVISSEDSIIVGGGKTQKEIDEELYQFCLDAQDKSNDRHVGLFADYLSEELSENNLIMLGKISTSMKATDLLWNGGIYSTTPTPKRKWDFIVQPMFENVYENVPLEEVLSIFKIENNFDIANYGSERNAYYDDDGVANNKVSDLQNLTLFLKDLLNKSLTVLTNMGVTGTNLEIVNAYTDYSLVGINYQPYYAIEDGGEIVDRDGTDVEYLPVLTYTPVSYFSYERDYEKYGAGGEAKRMVFGSDTTATIPENCSEIYFDVKMLDVYLSGSESYGDFTWNNLTPEISIADFIYKLASELGFYLRSEFVNGTTVRITPVPRQEFIGSSCYIIDSTSASLNTDFISNGVKSSNIAKGTRTTQDGLDRAYHDDYGLGVRDSLNGEGVAKSYLTTSINEFNDIARHEIGLYHSKLPQGRIEAIVPVNTKTYMLAEGGELSLALDSTMPTSSIYMKHIYDSAPARQYAEQYKPIKGVLVEIDGVEKSFDTLTEYLATARKHDSKYHETEYELTIPSLMGFSSYSNGDEPHLKNLKLGSKITLDSKEYVVISISRNYKAITTKIKLTNISRFNFSHQTVNQDTPEKGGGGSFMGGGNNNSDEALSDLINNETTTIAASQIKTGQVVSLIGSQEVIYSEPLELHYHNVYGVALNDAEIGESVKIALPGSVVSTNVVSIAGDPVYLRKTPSVDVNTSIEPLTAKNEDEDMHLQVGTALSSTSYLLRFNNKHIFE